MAAAESLTGVAAFNGTTARDFLEFIGRQSHINRFRMSYDRKAMITAFCLNPRQSPGTQEESWASQFAREFLVIDGQLHRKPEPKDSSGWPRLVVLDDGAFHVIVRTHLRLGHAGYKKSFAEIQDTYYDIVRKEVQRVIVRCRNCALNRPSSTRAPLQPIEVEETFERVQIDVINMRHEPDRQYLWILHAKDHFSKLTGLWALKAKEAEQVTEALEQWLMLLGVPCIIQYDNGTEFKGAHLILLHRHGIKCINGNPRSPQTQGLIEQGNRVVEYKLRA